MNKEQWEKEFDKKFVPKYPKSGFEPIDGLTANIFTIKDFIKDLLKQQRQEIKRIKYDSYADGYGVGLEDGADMKRQEIIEMGDKIKDTRENKIKVYAGENGQILSNCNDYQKAYNQAIKDYQTKIKTLTKQKL